MKFDRLAASGVLGGDVAQLLGGVLENIVVFTLAWVPSMMFGLCARIPLGSLSVSLGFNASASLS
jgi:hypothetical protein